jgi:hypothetical protein
VHFTILWLEALFFNHPKCIGPAVVCDDDAMVSYGAVPPLAGARTSAASLMFGEDRLVVELTRRRH